MSEDIAALRAHSARVFDRMKRTPYGPKRKRLASQHVDLANEADRLEIERAAVDQILAALDRRAAAHRAKGQDDEAMALEVFAADVRAGIL